MSINLSDISGWATFEAGYSDSTLPAKPLFRLLGFGILKKDSAQIEEDPLLSTRFMLLNYSFEFRPNNHALGTAGLVMIIGLSIKGC